MSIKFLKKIRKIDKDIDKNVRALKRTEVPLGIIASQWKAWRTQFEWSFYHKISAGTYQQT